MQKKEEKAYVDAVLAAKKTEFLKLFDTKKGQIVLETETEHQRRLRKARNNAMKGLSKAEQKVQRVKNKFEIYDIDGDGVIDKEEFALIAADLCITLSEKKLDAAFDTLDVKNEGAVDFETFHTWFLKVGKKSAKGFGALMMKATKRTKSMSGSIDTIRAKRALLKQCLDKARVEARREFREKYLSETSKSSEDSSASPTSSNKFDDAAEKQRKGRVATKELVKIFRDDSASKTARSSTKRYNLDHTLFFYLDNKGEEVGPIAASKFLTVGNENTFVWFKDQPTWFQVKENESVRKWLRRSQWFVIDILKKRHEGPFTWSDIEDRDDFDDELYVWKRGMLEWKKIGDLEVHDENDNGDSELFDDL